MKRLAQVAAFLLVVCGAIWFTSSRQSHNVRGRFDGRSGAADAKAALQARRPPKLFVRSVYGLYVGLDTPGVTGCFDPRLQIGLPEASYDESDSTQSASSAKRAGDAFRYATDFNRETVRLRFSELKKICPEVALQ